MHSKDEITQTKARAFRKLDTSARVKKCFAAQFIEKFTETKMEMYTLRGSEYFFDLFILYIPEAKIAEFESSVDLDGVAHNELPHLDLHCLCSSL